jgi:hypothetical protein
MSKALDKRREAKKKPLKSLQGSAAKEEKRKAEGFRHSGEKCRSTRQCQGRNLTLTAI